MNENSPEEIKTKPATKISRKKLLCGLVVFTISFLAPLFIPIVLKALFVYEDESPPSR